MSVQMTTPTSGTMPQLVVIPATISTLGPHLSRLPDELIHQIFKIIATSMFPKESRLNKLINPQIFNILNHHCAVKKIRNVSSDFADFFMEAFYENFHFAFKHCAIFNQKSDHLTSFPAPLPRAHLRHHLRSLRIEVALENYYYTPQTNFSVPRTSLDGREIRSITTVDEMMAFCPSARFLRHLTEPEVGFTALRFLDLHLRTDFRLPVDEDFLRVLQEANFVFKAAKVQLTVTDIAGFASEQEERVQRVLEQK